MGHKYTSRNNKNISEASIHDGEPIREREKEIKNTNCETSNLTGHNKNEIAVNGLQPQDTRFKLKPSGERQSDLICYLKDRRRDRIWTN